MKPIKECSLKLPFEKAVSIAQLSIDVIDEDGIITGTADGNGMSDFDIWDKDLLFFSTMQAPKIGDVVLVGINGEKPIARQILADLKSDKYVLHASGVEEREDIYTDNPEIYGVLAYILRRYKNPQKAD